MAANETAKEQTEEFVSRFNEAMRQGLDQVDALYDEWLKLEKKATVHASNAVDDYAKLVKASIDYVTEVNDQMRSVMLQSLRSFQPHQ